jgi:23S rRNA (pseudouridine1915-N3)-methyltransferase
MVGCPAGCDRIIMLINILSVGLPKDKHIQHLTDSYLERTKKYTSISLKTIKQEPLASNAETGALRKEAKKLIHLMEDCYNIVLDKDGDMMGSELFANFLNKRIMSGIKVMNIIIGGPTGIDVSVKQRAEKVMSLSPMTFPHELTMVIIAEQIYRAFAILHGLPYHK